MTVGMMLKPVFHAIGEKAIDQLGNLIYVIADDCSDCHAGTEVDEASQWVNIGGVANPYFLFLRATAMLWVPHSASFSRGAQSKMLTALLNAVIDFGRRLCAGTKGCQFVTRRDGQNDPRRSAIAPPKARGMRNHSVVPTTELKA
jgi:hypothetical protein